MVEPHGRPFYTYTYSRLRDHHTTQDVVQCALIKLHQKWLADPEIVEKNRAYAFTILRNAVRDHLRTMRRESGIISDRSDVGMPDAHPVRNDTLSPAICLNAPWVNFRNDTRKCSS